MPKINYGRGETKEFVVRKNNWSTKKTYQCHNGKRRKGGLCHVEVYFNVGYGGIYCACCTPYPQDSRRWKKEVSRYYRRVVNKRLIQEQFLDYLSE